MNEDFMRAVLDRGMIAALEALEARDVTVEDHRCLNYIRANSTGTIRDRAGALLVKLANLPGVAK